MFTLQRIYLNYPPRLFPLYSVIFPICRVELRSFYTKLNMLPFYEMNGQISLCLLFPTRARKCDRHTIQYNAIRKSRYLLIFYDTDCQLEGRIIFEVFVSAVLGAVFYTSLSCKS